MRAFVPDELPPKPPLDLSGDIQDRLYRAMAALGRLDSVATLLPDTSLFLYTYVRKEAVLSSQIEGTQSSLSDLLLFELEEAPGVPVEDVLEVSNYVAALEHGLNRVRQGFPLCNRLICEIHSQLLAAGRGASRRPGEIRTSQNWVGGSRPGNAAFVPPPPQNVPECLGSLERFLHDDPAATPTLIKAALAHVQFETIHPFLDGNGRVGRLLITLLFCVEGVLREPLLYLSLYFKRHRRTYYDLLENVRLNGDWESWLAFFADAVIETAEGATTTARDLTDLFRHDREKVQGLGRRAGADLSVHAVLQERPLATIRHLSERTGLSQPTVDRALGDLVELGIVREITGRKRNRVYAYARYLERLNRE